MKKVWSMFMLLAVCLVACTNIDDLEDDVDALKKRVTALETQVRDINSNTEALRELYNEGTFITNIEEKSDSYTLTLSNGKTVNLYMKNDNNLLCPIIGIDSEGYWTVLYNKNETPERLTVNGQPVKANGESGKTPTFNVDSEGYWQVSYDGGKNYSYIYKEGTTDKVSATGDGSAPTEDKNFKSVTVENNELVLVLAGEDAPTIRIPIVRDFECSFAAEDLKQVQEFSAGEVKEFTMTVRGVENTMITAPEGWSAKFSKEAGKENVLVVTAPASSAKMMTRATADNSTDIAVLATSGKYAMIAKIQVSIKNRTDYKAMFEAGELQIGEETLNPENYTSKVIDSNTTSDISSELGASEGTILFLTGTGTFTISSNKAIGAPIVIVGQYPDERPNLEFGETAYLSLKSGKLLLKNINIKARAANYLFNSPGSGDATFTNLTIEDCKMTNITKAMYYVSATTVGIGNITFKNSLFEFVNTGNIAFFNTTATVKPSIFGKLVLENNIIYHKTGVSPIQIFNWATGTSTTDEGTMTVNIKNNSFINVKGSNVFIKANKANIDYTNNIFCVSSESTITSYLYELKDAGSTVNTTDNILYDTKTNWNYANSDVCKPANNTLPKENIIPFTEIDCINGVFTKDPAYINNGATIE